MKNSVSLRLIILLLLLLSTLPIGISVSMSVIAKLENDAKALNSIGYIRGSSQRLVKNISIKHKQTIIETVEQKFNEIDTVYIPQNISYLKSTDFFTDYHELQRVWLRLKKSALEESTSQASTLLSEDSWNSADAAANSYENISKFKHDETMLVIFATGSFIFLLLIFSIILIYTKVKNKLEIHVIQDSLTKLYNRSYLFKILHSSIKSFERSKKPFSLIFIDIDRFKSINDNFGHGVGDEVLKNFATLLQDTLREDDIAFRYGGEEFVVLAKDTNASASCSFAERIRKKVEIHDFNTLFSVTISLGVSEFQRGDALADIINRADDMMYQAKAEGRNRTCLYTAQSPSV